MTAQCHAACHDELNRLEAARFSDNPPRAVELFREAALALAIPQMLAVAISISLGAAGISVQ